MTILLIGSFFLSSCGQAKTQTIKIGVNAELTGDVPKVGEGTKYAAEMWLEDVKAAGGLEVGVKISGRTSN